MPGLATAPRDLASADCRNADKGVSIGSDRGTKRRHHVARTDGPSSSAVVVAPVALLAFVPGDELRHARHVADLNDVAATLRTVAVRVRDRLRFENRFALDELRERLGGYHPSLHDAIGHTRCM